MLFGLLTAWLGNENTWTPENQEQFATKSLPFERMIQAFHQRGEPKHGKCSRDNISHVVVATRTFHTALGKGKYTLCKLEKLNEL